MEKIVVLGAAGFIGGAVCRKLEEKGIPFEPIVTSSVGPMLHDRASWLLDRIRGADVLYVCAGRTGGVGRMSSDPFSFVYSNVKIHMNVFEACARARVPKLICVQSTTGYPDTPRPVKETEYHEGVLHPAYFVPGTAHRFIDHLARMHQKDFQTTFFRPSNVYGPGNNFNPYNAHVIEATVRKVAEHQDPFVIWGTGKEVRDAIYIDDLAEAMVLALHAPAGAYNVASGEEMDVNQIVRVLLEHEGYTPQISHDLSKPTAIRARRVDMTFAQDTLGWAPKVPMKAGLIRTLEWYRNNA